MAQNRSSVTEAAVSVRLFGPPRIERTGEAAPVDTRKAVALLAYLALAGRPQSRDHLATMLWPEADQTRARSALRRTLSTLNGALGSRGLRIERESLTFTGEDVWIDVNAFREAASSTHDPASWAFAAELYSGEFLAGFVLRDSPEFDEWQLATADGLRRELGATLERLAASVAPTDRDVAIAYAQRWVDLDPMHEAAHRELMRLYAEGGDRPAALRQYRTCVAALERDLGVEPLDETTELYESIRESRPVQPAPASVPVAPTADLPLVGRGVELSEIAAGYSAASAGGQLFVIAGEPGIGKTRLATEFVTGVRASGGVVLETRCHPEEERLPFGTCVELLHAARSEGLTDRSRSTAPGALEEASRLLPELSEDTPPTAALDSPAARHRLLEGVSEVLASPAGTPPGVVFVDDVQWMDVSSRDVLRFLVRRLRGRPLLILLTWRTEDVPPGHPFDRMLSDAIRAGNAGSVVLPRLSASDVSELARSVIAPPEIASRLFEETAGVPFFVAEYLRAPTSSERLPTGIRDLLSSRVEGVTKGASQVLAAAAVLGRPADPATVRETSGRREEEVVSALEELVAAGLVAEASELEGRYDVTHPKLRDYVYDNTTLGRRRILHARAAKALLRRSRRRPELVALAAHHLERAGDEDAAAERFVEAGHQARSLYANAEALSHYRSAIALGHPEDATLHEAIGDLLTLDGRYAEAIASYERAAALGADLSVVGRKLGGVHHRLGDWTSAEAHYLEAEEALAGRPGSARILAERSLNAHRADRSDDAVALAEQALREAASDDDPRSLAQAHNITGILASRRGNAASAREHLGSSLDISERLDDPAATAAALNNLALVLRAEGAAALALTHATRARELCRQIGDRHREAAVLSNIADILRDLDRVEEAIDRVKVSAAIFADIGEPGRPQPEIWKLTEW